MRSAGLIILGGLLVLACNVVVAERTCRLLDAAPAQVGDMTLQQVEELAGAARASDSADIREIGEQMTQTINQRHALENLAPGSTVEILETHVQRLGEACQALG